MTSRVWLLIPLLAPLCHGSGTGKLPVRVTWGYTRSGSSTYSVKATADRGMNIGSVTTDRLQSPGIDGIQFVLECPPREEPGLQQLQVIWADLLAAADPDTARRPGHDAAIGPLAPR